MSHWRSTVQVEVNRENISATWAFFSSCDVNISCATSVAVWAGPLPFISLYMHTAMGLLAGCTCTAMGMLAGCIQPWGCWQAAYSHVVSVSGTCCASCGESPRPWAYIHQHYTSTGLCDLLFIAGHLSGCVSWFGGENALQFRC